MCRCMVQVQKHMKLHITKELTEKDVVSRIMRKENYLIGMLNKVFAIPSAAAHPLLFRVGLGAVVLRSYAQHCRAEHRRPST